MVRGRPTPRKEVRILEEMNQTYFNERLVNELIKSEEALTYYKVLHKLISLECDVHTLSQRMEEWLLEQIISIKK